jgi:hypothetical protein
MSGGTINYDTISTQLSPTIQAVVAHTTALVMMNHHPLPYLHSIRIDIFPNVYNIATGFVTSDNRTTVAA